MKKREPLPINPPFDPEINTIIANDGPPVGVLIAGSALVLIVTGILILLLTH